jgi:protein-L-isoaspartate(D-aspartate) O-methyltransferase
VIYVSAGASELPMTWLDALSQSGRLIFPLAPRDEVGAMFLVTRMPRGFLARAVCRARFYPCVGTQDANTSADLTDAFRKGGFDSVRSLRRAPELPDSSCWFAGTGWWLSKVALP